MSHSLGLDKIFHISKNCILQHRVFDICKYGIGLKIDHSGTELPFLTG